MLRLKIFFVSFLLLLGLAGSLRAESLVVTKIAAVVNGEMITLYDIQAVANAELTRMGIGPGDPRYASALPELMLRVLDNRINDILLRQEATRLKVQVTDQEVDNELRKFIQRSQMSREEFEKELSAKGETVEMVRDKIRDNILTQRIISFMISRKVVVTKEEIEKHYQANKDQYVKGKFVDVSLLVFPPQADAEKIAADIKSGKLKFADAVAKYSVGPTPDKGGNIGNLPWDEMAQDWKQVLGPMSPGEVSGIFEIRRLKSLLKLNATTPGAEMTLDEAIPQIEDELRSPLLNARFEEYITQLRSRSVIDIRL